LIPIINLIKEIIAAMIGTVAFSVLFSVPRQYYLHCGLIGGAGWAVYSLMHEESSVVTASVVATMVVVLLSRISAVWNQCPVTVFLISGIFPLVPGTYVYWTAYYLVTDQLSLASESGYMALTIAFAIVLGIVLVFGIPQRVFQCFARRKLL
jgi:uncharacterized membrane protein YjjB (DUF3815 family)